MFPERCGKGGGKRQAGKAHKGEQAKQVDDFKYIDHRTSALTVLTLG